MLASAVAARTQRLALSPIFPFYDPVRLAEDVAVLDIFSAGRVSYILALGYRPEEYEIFGLDLGDRAGWPTRSWLCCAGCWPGRRWSGTAGESR